MSFQPGTYRIKNARSDTYLDASLQGQVHGWASHPGQENQKWRIERSGRGYKIQNAETGGYLHANGPGNGTSVCCRGDPTEWDIQDRYSIAIAGTQSVCDLDYGKRENGTTVNIWGYTGVHHQCWHFENQGGQGGDHGEGQQQRAGNSDKIPGKSVSPGGVISNVIESIDKALGNLSNDLKLLSDTQPRKLEDFALIGSTVHQIDELLRVRQVAQQIASKL